MLHTPLPERHLSESCVCKFHLCLKLSVGIMLSLLCLLEMLLWTWWLQLLCNSKLIINSAKTNTDLGYQCLDSSSASTHLKIHFKIFESLISKKRYLRLITTAPWDFSAFSVSRLSWPSLIFYNVPPSPFAQFLLFFFFELTIFRPAWLQTRSLYGAPTCSVILLFLAWGSLLSTRYGYSLSPVVCYHLTM